MGLPFDNSAATLEYIARQHWDRYLATGQPRSPGDIGLVRPYAAGGVIPAGGVALVGERGPELVRLGVTSGVSPYATTLNIFGGVLGSVQAGFQGLAGFMGSFPQAVDVLAGIRGDIRDYRAGQALRDLSFGELLAGIGADLGEMRQATVKRQDGSDAAVVVLRTVADDLREFKTRSREQLADLTLATRRLDARMDDWDQYGQPPVRKTAGAQQ
jgi:hypothetical protein